MQVVELIVRPPYEFAIGIFRAPLSKGPIIITLCVLSLPSLSVYMPLFNVIALSSQSIMVWLFQR